MRILITGAAGFVGFHLAARCLVDGHEVVGVDNLDPYYDVALKQARLARLLGERAFRFERIDLAEEGPFAALMAEIRPDVVVHLAAQAGVRYSIEAPQAYIRANIQGFLTVLEACRRVPVRHLIYASSSSVYGQSSTVPFSEDQAADRPVSLYAATKRANELMAHSYAHLFAIPATGLRFFTVYGPWGRPDMMYFKFTEAVLRGESIDVFNHGVMERDFTYVDDVIAGIMPLLTEPPARDSGPDSGHESGSAVSADSAGEAPHRVLNIGNNRPVTLARFIEAIEHAAGRRALRNFLPMQPGDVLRTCASIDAIASLSGFSPQTEVEVGVARFVAWYRDFYHRHEAPAEAELVS